MTTMRETTPPRPVVGVQGLAGGVGASTLAAALAVRAASAGRRSLLVDSDRFGPGADLLLGMEEVDGLRWPDLELLSGDADGPALLTELPGRGELATLSWDRRPHRTGPTAPWQVVAALSGQVDLTVVDLPALGAAGQLSWWHACDEVVLVLGTGLDRFAAALAAGDLVPRVVGVVRREGAGAVPAATIADAFGVPVLAGLRHDGQVATALARGEAVGTAGELACCADRLLAGLLRGMLEVA